MNYCKIYNLIIRNRIINPIDGYTETHHIIPRSLGGSNDLDNLVKLSAREHYICHFLLMKMYKYGTVEWCKMVKAFSFMSYGHSNYHNRYVNSRFYELLRRNFSLAQSVMQTGIRNSQYGTMWICNLELKKNKKIKKTDIIPDGWINGKVVNFDSHYKKLQEKIIKKQNLEQKTNDKIIRLKEIMYYYRDNDISIRNLTKKFNVGHNIYKSFELYFKDEYYEIVKTKSGNSNTTKGRYKLD
jgi:hypothetical protein